MYVTTTSGPNDLLTWGITVIQHDYSTGHQNDPIIKSVMQYKTMLLYFQEITTCKQI